MTKTPQKTLEVIGTARKPNDSDLKNRGLSGLLNPSADIVLRRAELESEQAALRAQEALFRGESSVSFLRTKISVQRRSNNDTSSDPEIDSNTLTEDGVSLDVDEEQIVGVDITGNDGGVLEPSAYADVPELLESLVADDIEAGGSQEAMRRLRNRSPIQLHPYELEREVYHQTVKTGRVE